MLFTVTEFNKNLRDSKGLPYCFCFGVENVILVLFLGKKKNLVLLQILGLWKDVIF